MRNWLRRLAAPLLRRRQAREEQALALLKARYGIDAAATDAVGVIETIARKRGCLIKGRGGEFDLEKAAAILLVDYRSGALGRITLETPALRAERQATLPAQPPAAVDPENP